MNIYWIGGSPCSGKSSVARWIAEQHNFNVYQCDVAFDGHMAKATKKKHPTITKLGQLSPDEMWLSPVEEQLKRSIDIYKEEFSMILEDLKKQEKPLIVEGSALMPVLLHDHGVDPRQAIWYVPTREFQTYYYSQRKWIDAVIQPTEDPDKAFENWMERDHRFAKWIEAEAKERNYRCVTVDKEHAMTHYADIAEKHFGLATS